MHEQIIAQLTAEMSSHRTSQRHWEEQVKANQRSADYYKVKANQLQRAIEALKTTS